MLPDLSPNLSSILSDLLTPAAGSDLPGAPPTDPSPVPSLPTVTAGLPMASPPPSVASLLPSISAPPQPHGAGDLIRTLAPMLIAAVTGARNPLEGAALASGYAQGANAALNQKLTLQARAEQQRQLAAKFMQQTAADVHQFKDPLQRQQYLTFADKLGAEQFGLPPGWTQSVPGHDATDGTFAALKDELTQKLQQFDSDKKWVSVAGTPAEAKISFKLSDGSSVPVSTARQLVGQAVYDSSTGQQAFAPEAPDSGKTTEERMADLLTKINTAKARGDVKTATTLQGQYDAIVQSKRDLTNPPTPQLKEAQVGGKRVFLNYDPSKPAGQRFTDPDTGQPVKGAAPIAPVTAATQSSIGGPVVLLKPGEQGFRTAQDLAYGKLTFSQLRTMLAYSRDASAKQKLYDTAASLNPNFNPAGFEMGFKLASNPKVQQQLASLDNVVQAAPDLIALSDKAARSGATAINKITNPIKIAIGNQTFTNFHAAQIAFADELSGALGYGSATDMSREMGFNMTDPNLSPANFAASIQDVVIPFIERKRRTLLDQMGTYGQPGMNPAADKAAKPPAAGKPTQIGRFTVTVGGGD